MKINIDTTVIDDIDELIELWNFIQIRVCRKQKDRDVQMKPIAYEKQTSDIFNAFVNQKTAETMAYILNGSAGDETIKDLDRQWNNYRNGEMPETINAEKNTEQRNDIITNS